MAIEPYLVTLTEESEVFPLFQHAGIEFIHLLEGEVVYRAADTTYHLRPGDSLLFDGDVAHGPEKLVRPARSACWRSSRGRPTSAERRVWPATCGPDPVHRTDPEVGPVGFLRGN